MTVYAPDATLNNMLDYIINHCGKLTICSTQPTTYAEANSTYKLGSVVVSSSAFSLANGDVSGRKITVAQQSNVPITTNGTAQHIALLDPANSVLLAVTTCTSKPVMTSNSATIPTFDIELRDLA